MQSPLFAEEPPCPAFTLARAEEVALENNREVQTTRELLEKAREGRLESLSKWFPALTAMSRTFRTQHPQQPYIDSRTSFETSFQVTQAIFSSDLYYNVKIAKLIEKHLALLLEAALNDVLFRVRSLYYQLILDLDTIRTAQEQIDLLVQLSHEMQGRYDVGEAILFNVNQSKVAIANAMTIYYQASKQYKVDYDRFAEVLGYDPGTVNIALEENEIPIFCLPELAEKLDKMEQIFVNDPAANEIFYPTFPQAEMQRMSQLFSCDEIDVWEEVAQSHRPDLLLSRNTLDIASEKIKSRLGEYFPILSAVANYGGEPTDIVDNLSSRFNNQKFSWGVGIKLNWTLFDGLGRERRIQQARHERNASRFSYEKSLQNAHAEVRRRIFEIEESIASYLTAASNVKLAEMTTELVKQQLDVGYVTIFDYQISINGLFQAKNTQNKARYDLILSYYGLRHASGIDLAK